MSRKPNLLASVLKGEAKEAPAPTQTVSEAQVEQPETGGPAEDNARPKLRGKVPYAGQESDRTDPASIRAGYVAPSRAGKAAKTHYLPVAYWDTLAEVAFRTRDENGKRVSQERFIAEALNLLFQKYNYPVVRE